MAGWRIIVTVVVIAAAGVSPACTAARLLLTGRFDHEADPSGYAAYTAARSFRPQPNKKRISNTPEAAESMSASSFVAVYRATAVGAGPLSFATVESDPEAVNPTRRKETVKPRGWVAQDLGNLVPRPIDVQSGAGQVPIMVTNGAAAAQTYEGATAAALPEAIQINQGGTRGKRKTVVANSMITSSTPAVPKASKHGSLASTAQPVTALALSGTATGGVSLAQADSAVAMAVTERVDRTEPISRTAWQN
ncbi:hypothetical protein OEZ86_003255 [Tetradesmus obliquus]|uniref:Uncharacterized protein n=1 Tax=Tetradesmus obliquus TaxID=3088 RepID=A0ABY8TVE9_TETOB|nr:hypothetical protein OEZ85_012358 [Tetradesmus obliquus]WIA32433.1 hypothetical protein OEZ86_003255 [Tetradesmus obliquus]